MASCGHSIAAALLAAAVACGTSAAQAQQLGGEPLDARVRYTVDVASKLYGNVQATRVIVSGQTDDYTWKTRPPGNPPHVDLRCPGADDLPLDADHTLLRMIQLRLAPVVGAHGDAQVQLSFQAVAPQPAHGVARNAARCPAVRAHSEVVRFTMHVDGKPETLKLADGTQVTVRAQH